MVHMNRSHAFLSCALVSFGVLWLGSGCAGFTGDGDGLGHGGSGATGTGDASGNPQSGPAAGSTSTGAACATECASTDHATGACVDGACVYTCAPGWGNCDDAPSDCEVDTTVDGNCGACGTSCASGDCEIIGDAPACNDPVDIVAGDTHTCALRVDGSVWCWGLNNFGQVGAATGISIQQTPAKVVSLPKPALQISARGSSSCALLDDHTVWCWGRNGSNLTGAQQMAGAMANNASVSVGGTFDPGSSPALGETNALKQVSGAVAYFLVDSVNQPGVSNKVSSGVTFVAAGGAHSCALNAANTVTCWGDNRHGQTGQASLVSAQAPLVLSNVTAKQIVGGEDFTCAITPTDGIKCWGANSHGQTGIHFVGSLVAPPHDVDLGGATAASLVAGHHHGGAITTDGELFLWGFNDLYQTSLTPGDADAPTEYAGVSDVAKAALGWHHTCALSKSGKVVCWGGGSSGQLGNGSTDNHTSPVDVLWSAP